MKGKVLAVSVSKKKGTAKRPVAEIELIEDMGVKDDAHFGYKPRQVSILPWEEVEKFNSTHKTQIGFGAFAENIAIKGIPPEEFKQGTKIKVGTAELTVTQIGKVCHSGCNIEKLLGDCIMPKYGIFCKVVKGGMADDGASIEVEG